MTRSEPSNIRPSVQDVALIIGGGPGISASCAKLFAENDMRVGIAATSSGAFAMACHAKSGLAESAARELMPQGIHVANVPIDAAIGWTQEDGSRAHPLAGTTVDDNMADPDRIAETYLQLHRQHRSTWAFEIVLRPWLERWRQTLSKPAITDRWPTNVSVPKRPHCDDLCPPCSAGPHHWAGDLR